MVPQTVAQSETGLAGAASVGGVDTADSTTACRESQAARTAANTRIRTRRRYHGKAYANRRNMAPSWGERKAQVNSAHAMGHRWITFEVRPGRPSKIG